MSPRSPNPTFFPMRDQLVLVPSLAMRDLFGNGREIPGDLAQLSVTPIDGTLAFFGDFTETLVVAEAGIEPATFGL
jgi:hypothetical protein